MPKINCIIVDDEPMAREILKNYLQKIPVINLVKSCKNVAEAIEITSNNKIDLILLDINMPEISGLTFAKIIDKKIKVIFTTAYREYAVDGFDIQAVDYLLKPISFERFQQAINKYVDLSESKLSVNNNSTIEKNNYIFVRSDRKMIKINFEDISYIESLSDYLKIHLHNKTIVTRETISNMEAKLGKNGFLRIHRSFIVSLAKITSYTNDYVEINKKALPISRTYKDFVLKIFMD
jgi:DNA-binding LytR/AlgR family response regulator